MTTATTTGCAKCGPDAPIGEGSGRCLRCGTATAARLTQRIDAYRQNGSAPDENSAGTDAADSLPAAQDEASPSDVPAEPKRPARATRHNAETVVADIKALAAKLGRAPVRNDDGALAQRATHYHGTWANAVVAAGYPRPTKATRRGGLAVATPPDPPAQEATTAPAALAAPPDRRACPPRCARRRRHAPRSPPRARGDHVSNPQKRKGDRAEIEVQGILRDLLGVPARRALGAGRLDDMGDITGVPDTVIQVANYRDVNEAIRRKLPEAERQRENAGATFAATFIRRAGGSYVVVMSPEQWACMWREATA